MSPYFVDFVLSAARFDIQAQASIWLVDWSPKRWQTVSYLITREAAWYHIGLISVVCVCLSVCQTITFESLDVKSSYLHIWYISRESPENTGQVRIWRSSDQSQGHRSKKVENPYSRNVKLRSATTFFYKNTEAWSLRVAWGFQLWRIDWCDRHLCHVTGSD